jgi:hypothetical protein
MSIHQLPAAPRHIAFSWLEGRPDRLGDEAQSEAIPVDGVARPLEVKIASTPDEWRQAFNLVTRCYKKYGYEPRDSRGLRFTPFHLLPETVTLVAKAGDQVVASFSLVPDNDVLGLPLEGIYGAELRELRRGGRLSVEVTTFAAEGLAQREFAPVVVALFRLGVHYMSANHQADPCLDHCLIAVRKHHVPLYRKYLGFDRWGPPRPHPKVCYEPREVEGLRLNPASMRARSPQTYAQIFGSPIPDMALRPVVMPLELALHFARESSDPDCRLLSRLLRRRAVQESLPLLLSR